MLRVPMLVGKTLQENVYLNQGDWTMVCGADAMSGPFFVIDGGCFLKRRELRPLHSLGG